MIVEIKVPEVGESITEGVLVEWLAEDGAVVAVDDPLFELETDKITLTVAAEAAGKLSQGAEAESTVQVGPVVGTLDTEAAGAGEGAPQGEPAAEPEQGQDHDGLSPAVRRLVEEYGLDPTQLEGTGPGGRVTKGDVLAFIEQHAEAPVEAESVAKPASGSTARAPWAANACIARTARPSWASRWVSSAISPSALTCFSGKTGG